MPGNEEFNDLAKLLSKKSGGKNGSGSKKSVGGEAGRKVPKIVGGYPDPARPRRNVDGKPGFGSGKTLENRGIRKVGNKVRGAVANRLTGGGAKKLGGGAGSGVRGKYQAAKNVGQAVRNGGQSIRNTGRALKPSEWKNTAKKVGRKAVQTAKTLGKQAIKKGLREGLKLCVKNPYCAAGLGIAILLVAGFIGMIMLASYGGEDFDAEETTGIDLEARPSPFLRSGAGGEYGTVEFLIEWSLAGRLLGSDGVLVVENEVDVDVLRGWVSAGSSAGKVRVLKDDVCGNAFELAKGFRTAALHLNGESINDHPHRQVKNEVQPVWKGNPPFQGRYDLCHEAYAMLKMLDRLWEWESVDRLPELEELRKIILGWNDDDVELFRLADGMFSINFGPGMIVRIPTGLEAFGLPEGGEILESIPGLGFLGTVDDFIDRGAKWGVSTLNKINNWVKAGWDWIKKEPLAAAKKVGGWIKGLFTKSKPEPKPEDVLGDTDAVRIRNQEVLRAYERSIEADQPGFAPAGRRILLMWMTYSRWQHMYVTAAAEEVEGVTPYGLKPCNLGGDPSKHLDWINDTISDSEDHLVIFEPCPPPPTPHTCSSYREAVALWEGGSGGGSSTGSENVANPAAAQESRPEFSGPDYAPAYCALLTTQYHCSQLGWEDEGCTQTAEETAEALQRLLDELQQEMLDGLEEKRQPLPGRMLSSFSHRTVGLGVVVSIVSAMLEADVDGNIIDDTLERSLVETLWDFECEADFGDGDCDEHPMVSEENTLEKFFDELDGGAHRNALTEWREGKPRFSAELESLGSLDWDEENRVWVAELPTGRFTTQPAGCPWLMIYTYGAGSVSHLCPMVSGRNPALLKVLNILGYDPANRNRGVGLLSSVNTNCATDFSEGDLILSENDPRLRILPSKYAAGGGNTIFVHACIYDALMTLLQWFESKVGLVDTDGDGVGDAPARPLLVAVAWRSVDTQEQLRLLHCKRNNPHASDHELMYTVSPSTCTPPTAVPKTSRHQFGLAIDFANCSTRDSTCFNQLDEYMGRLNRFLVNLPSEPWHWSIDGN